MFIYHLPSVQIFCWSVSVNKRMEKHVPFCIELKRETFENIHALLTSYKTYDSDDSGKTLTMSTLKLLKLQVGLSFSVFQSIHYWYSDFPSYDRFTLIPTQLCISLFKTTVNYRYLTTNEDLLKFSPFHFVDHTNLEQMF